MVVVMVSTIGLFSLHSVVPHQMAGRVGMSGLGVDVGCGCGYGCGARLRDCETAILLNFDKKFIRNHKFESTNNDNLNFVKLKDIYTVLFYGYN